MKAISQVPTRSAPMLPALGACWHPAEGSLLQMPSSRSIWARKPVVWWTSGLRAPVCLSASGAVLPTMHTSEEE
jgi:hypothetical protein